MSESENKEVAQKPSDNRFEEALKKGGEEGLKEAFNVLLPSEDAVTARVDAHHLQLALTARGGPQLSHDHLQNTITELNEKGEFNFLEFDRLIKLLLEPGEADQPKKIYEKLKAAGEGETINLHGDEGVGKTWMAREAAALALRNRDFDAVIWVFLNRIYEGLSLHESIAYQMSVLAKFERSEAEEKKKKKNKADEKKNKADEKKKMDTAAENDKIQEKMRQHIEQHINEAVKEKKLLFILDSEGSRTEAVVSGVPVPKEKDKSGEADIKEKKLSEGSRTEADVSGVPVPKEKDKSGEADVSGVPVPKVNVSLKLSVGRRETASVVLEKLKSYKILVTRRNDPEANKIMVKVKPPFTWAESKALANRALERERVADDAVKHKAQELALYFMFMSKRLPSQLLLISRIVSHFAKEGRLQKLIEDRELVKKGEDVLDVLIKDYTRLPKGMLIDCYSKETAEEHFLRRGKKVNFNALICYWIMEGHLGHFDRIEDAYMEGHRVLMELMNCGLLDKQESDYVVSTGTTIFNFAIHDYKDFFSGVRPGLALTFDMRLGRVALANGMIKTLGDNISTLLLDGNRISEEVEEDNPATKHKDEADSPATNKPTSLVENLKKHKEEVEVLAINEPTSQHFELPILEMRKLRLLALRGCLFLDNLEHFLPKESDGEDHKKPTVNPGSSINVEKPDQELKSSSFHIVSEQLEALTVLEISGPSSIETIPEQIFNLMPNLKTLNLSNLLKVKSLPNSFYQLTKIEFLILRGCESLIELKSIKNFKDLKVLDISNATNFQKFEDKSLHSNQKLQIINLSNTKLKTLPLINQLEDLKFVWLKDCKVLPRIRKIDKLGNLKILDISGCAEVERFCDPSLEDLNRLLIVDISRTSIKRLPANIGDPTYLYANNCSKIRVVPPVEGLQELQVLHLSGCERLREIRHEFFERVKGLKELDLSKTMVKELPFLSSLTSLRRLLLSECELLEKLEKLSKLEDLEYLDLSGCKALTELEDETFNKMLHLQHLDLSRTGLGQKQLPSLSKLKNLKQLLVRDCANLTELRGVEELTSLEVLDYSGTVLKRSTPIFSSGDRQPQEIGAGIESIEINKLFRDLGVVPQGDTQGAKWDDFTYEEVSLYKWNISNWRVEAEDKLGTPVYGAHFNRLFNKYPAFLENNLSTFRFLVYPSEERLPPDFNASYNDELILRDIYFKQVCGDNFGRLLEIRGFSKLPTSLKPLIQRAHFVALVEDPFLRSLLDLGADRTMAMKACWIESCNEFRHVVVVPEKKPEETDKSGGEAKKTAGGKLQELVKGEGEQQKKEGDSTKSESDPPKNNVAAAETTKGQDDQQNNANAEQSGEATKGQDDQQNNANAEQSGEAATNEGNEHKSGEPEKNAGDDKTGESEKSQGNQPKNEEKSEELPKSEGDEQKDGEKTKELAKSEDDAKKSADQQNSQEQGKTEELKNHAEDLNNLETLWISNISNLESILKGDIQSVSFTLLKSLYLEYCPNISQLTTSSSQLPSLETLYIKYCQNLIRLFAEDKAPKLDKLLNLQLWGLDSLEKIDCEAPYLQKMRVGQCPMLEYVIASRLKKEGEEDEGTARIRHENEGHESLEVLHIKSCDKLKSICESSSQEEAQLNKLKDLELCGLPELQKVACAVSALRVLRVSHCPSLESIVCGGGGVPDLETLEVRSCERMKIIDDRDSELKNIKKIQLLGLPKLEILGAKLLSQARENGDIRACPKLDLE